MEALQTVKHVYKSTHATSLQFIFHFSELPSFQYWLVQSFFFSFCIFVRSSVKIFGNFSVWMALFRSLLAATALFSTYASAEGVQGNAFGFASGTTGGGDASPAAPSSIAELKTWLSDDTPRVILIDKEFNFIGSEDTCTDCECCIPDSNTCGSSGQNAIKIDGSDWCGNYPSTKCTYDNAGLEGLTVASDKSIVGVGSAGILRGKGLRMTNNAKNIIIQNIHIAELNPQYIWGGDAITLDGTDNIWIDHVKVSLVGRQMFVSGYESSQLQTPS